MSHILLSAIASILAVTSFGAVKATGLEAQKDTNNEYEVIDLKNKVMRNYYDELDDAKKEDINYREFSQGYYNSGLAIKDYTQTVNQSSGTTRGAVAQWLVDDARTIISTSRARSALDSRPPRSEVLPQFNPEYLDLDWDAQHEMCFSLQEGRNPDIPVYYERELLATEQEKEDYVPWMANYLVPGDIVWDTMSILPIDGINIFTHMALVVNTCKRGYVYDSYNRRHNFNFVETIEAFASGVRFGFLDDDRILQNGSVLIRVKSSPYGCQPLRDRAVNFALKQYGKEYDVAGLLATDYPVPDTNKSSWYCTQLVVAAYFNSGFDITQYIAYPNPQYDVIDDNDRITTPIVADMIARGRFTVGIEGFNEEFEKHFVKFSNYGENKPYYITNTSEKTYAVGYTKKHKSWTDAIDNFKTICDRGVMVEPGQTVEADISETPWYEVLNLFNNTNVCLARDGNALYATLSHKFDDIWYPTYYQSTYDDFEITHYSNYCTVKITNRNSSAETYLYPSKLMSYKDAMEWNFPSGITKNTITIQPYQTVSVTIYKNADNMFAPFVLKDSSDENNAAIVRITPNSREYHTVTTGHISTTPAQQGGQSGGSTAPTYPKVTMSKSIDFYFVFGTFNPVCHGSAEWYEVEGSVADGSMAQCDWSTVQITSVQQWNNADAWNEYVYFDESDGRFYVNLSTFNRYPMGCVHIEYTYQASLILNNITLSGNYQKVFNFEDYFNSNNLVVTAHYTCGYSKTISRSDSNLKINSLSYNQYEAGTYTIFVEYTESGIKKTASYNVVVKEPALEYITLSGNYQTEYFLGDSINFDGLVVTAYFADGACEELSLNDVQIDSSDFDPTDTGTYEIAVSYTFDGITKSEYYYVTVQERVVLESITLSGDYQTLFAYGSGFNSNGLIVTANYSNGESHTVDDFQVFISKGSMIHPGNHIVTVSYTEDDVTVYEYYEITVFDNMVTDPLLTSITLSGNYQQVFIIGDSFDYSGLIVTAHFSDGSEELVKDFAVDASAVNMKRSGIYDVVVYNHILHHCFEKIFRERSNYYQRSDY